jgi:hypothetical protein
MKEGSLPYSQEPNMGPHILPNESIQHLPIYEGVSKSFWTGHLEGELQMVELSANMCSCVTILWVSLVSFATITLCVASQQMFIVVYFVIDSVWKLLDTPLYT